MKYLRKWLWTYCLLMLFVLSLMLCSAVIAKTLMLFTMEPVSLAILTVALAGAVSMVHVQALLYCINKYPELFEIPDWL